LNHPNILTVYDLGTEKGLPYMVSELLEGETLRACLRSGALPLPQCLDYARQILAGLAAAHAKGIVHRDLKPENLFLTQDGWVKILDFGLAKQTSGRAMGAESAAHAALETQPGTVLGTVGYMSPEQVRGRPANARSDLFSIGAVFYEMLSGRRAFAGESAVETMSAILTQEPAQLSGVRADVPPALERIVRRCLRKDPSERFESAHDVSLVLGHPDIAVHRLPERVASLRKSVAVLPFRDLARDPANAGLGVGLADATITELALVKSLLVRPTSSILGYEDRRVDPRAAGRELAVDAVVDGSFQRVGSRIRVTVQLVSAADGRSLWGSKIDAALDDLFQMQDQVSRAIAKTLAVEVTDGDERRRERRAREVRPAGDAYALYLKGRAHLLRSTLSDCIAAVDCFEKARGADPDFALACAGLAAAYERIAFTFQPEGDWYARAEVVC
jgi:serine/threonine-protein kinase